MESDNKSRGAGGIVISVRDNGDGQVRVTMDDVENNSGNISGVWEHRAFVTDKDYSKESFQSLNLSEKEFTSFGHYIFARLEAIHE